MVVVKKMGLDDLDKVTSFLRSNNHVVSKSYLQWLCEDKDSLSLINENKGITGVVLCKKTADLLEVIKWEGETQELFKEIMYKARVKGYNKIVTAEKEMNKDRIKALRKAGFEIVQTHEGLFPDEKAVMLVKEL